MEKKKRARLGGDVLEDERGQCVFSTTNTTQNKVRAVALGLCTIHVYCNRASSRSQKLVYNAA